MDLLSNGRVRTLRNGPYGMEMKHVLLVDDEQEICSLVCTMLSRAGYACHQAHSLTEGRAALQKRQFDAVVLDVHLPDGLGYDLIPEIRDRVPDARCITISAVDAERERAMANGSDAFLSKPFSRAQIMGLLQGAADQH